MTLLIREYKDQRCPAARVLQVGDTLRCVLMHVRRLYRREARELVSVALPRRDSVNPVKESVSVFKSATYVILLVGQNPMRRTKTSYWLEYVHPDSFQPEGVHYVIVTKTERHSTRNDIYTLDVSTNTWQKR